MDAEIKREFERLNQKLSALLQEAKKETWVKAGVITDLTGWNNEKMRQARENKYVEHKIVKGKFFYKLESLNPYFIKQKQTA